MIQEKSCRYARQCRDDRRYAPAFPPMANLFQGARMAKIYWLPKPNQPVHTEYRSVLSSVSRGESHRLSMQNRTLRGLEEPVFETCLAEPCITFRKQGSLADFR